MDTRARKDASAYDEHVLVLAMSTLTEHVLGGPSSYRPKDPHTEGADSGASDEDTYTGYSQLEVIPQFIYKGLGERITRIVILATKETIQPACFTNKAGGKSDSRATFDAIKKAYPSGSIFELEEKRTQISAVDFFCKRMAWEFKDDPPVIDRELDIIPIDSDRPEIGLSVLQRRIRDLYAACISSGGDWALWLDTHGGFRDISMAMFGLMQTLSAPDTDELVQDVPGNPAVSEVIKRMGDGRDTVPVSGVYTVEYDMQREVNYIIDRTSFYATFTKPAIESYMNYGQFAQVALKPNATVDGALGAYAFVSYRRIDALNERYAFLGTLKRNGYRYWYDYSIELQEDWADTLERANTGSAVFIALISRNYFSSYQCVKELRQALDEGKLVVLASLDGTSISGRSDDLTVENQSNPDESCTISGKEFAQLEAKQHCNLTNLVHANVFQRPSLEAKLEELCHREDAFRSIKD